MWSDCGVKWEGTWEGDTDIQFWSSDARTMWQTLATISAIIWTLSLVTTWMESIIKLNEWSIPGNKALSRVINVHNKRWQFQTETYWITMTSIDPNAFSGIMYAHINLDLWSLRYYVLIPKSIARRYGNKLLYICWGLNPRPLAQQSSTLLIKLKCLPTSQS